jgi:glycosyltransferase involved in cell wall biosynthesis
MDAGSSKVGGRDMQGLKIVHVLFSSRLAGAERYCLDLAAAQTAMGHEVHVVGAKASAMWAHVPKGVTAHGLAWPFFRGLRVRKLVQALGAGVVHAHLGPACRAAQAVPSVEGRVIRVATLHVGYKPHHHGPLDGVLAINPIQVKAISDLAVAPPGHSEPLSPPYRGRVKLLRKWAPEPLENEPGGEDFRQHRQGFRAELGLSDLALVVGCVGRLHPSKGMDLLVQAFRQVIAMPGGFPDAQLLLVGDGPQRAALQAMRGADLNIHITGQRSDIPRALAAMDVFVSPSREDAAPLAVLEAMAAGLPLVATATPGASDMLQNSLATVVPVQDVQALAHALHQAMLTCAHSSVKPLRLEYDMQAFSRQQQVQNLHGFYMECLNRSSA